MQLPTRARPTTPWRLLPHVLWFVTSNCCEPLSPYWQTDAVVELRPEVVRQGEPTTITIRVTNRGVEAIEVYAGGCWVPYRVGTLQGAPLTPQVVPCTLPTSTHLLAVGETYTLQATWDGRGTKGPVPSGEYRVWATPFLDHGFFGIPARVTITP